MGFNYIIRMIAAYYVIANIVLMIATISNGQRVKRENESIYVPPTSVALMFVVKAVSEIVVAMMLCCCGTTTIDFWFICRCILSGIAGVFSIVLYSYPEHCYRVQPNSTTEPCTMISQINEVIIFQIALMVVTDWPLSVIFVVAVWRSLIGKGEVWPLDNVLVEDPPMASGIQLMQGPNGSQYGGSPAMTNDGQVINIPPMALQNSQQSNAQ